MSRYNKTGGSTGSNQYQVRGSALQAATAPVSHVDLMRQIDHEKVLTIEEPPPPVDVDTVCEQFNKQVELARVATADLARQTSSVTDPAYLTELSDHPALEVRVAALQNRYTPVETLRSHYLAMVTNDRNVNVTNRNEYNAMLRHPDCPPEICMSVYKSGDGWEGDKTLAASHPNCPSHMLEISRDLYPSHVRAYHYSQATLASCTQSSRWEIREAVAQNKYTSPAALATLVKDTSKTVRKAVAENRNTPLQELLQLVKDKDKDVRDNALKNPSCPAHLRALASLL